VNNVITVGLFLTGLAALAARQYRKGILEITNVRLHSFDVQAGAIFLDVRLMLQNLQAVPLPLLQIRGGVFVGSSRVGEFQLKEVYILDPNAITEVSVTARLTPADLANMVRILSTGLAPVRFSGEVEAGAAKIPINYTLYEPAPTL
jgi:LEA14-like dessication related protein